MNLVCASETHEGRVKFNNEDTVYVNPERGHFLVCDGMGGEEYGEIASLIAAGTFAEMEDKGLIDSTEESFRNYIQEANSRIIDKCEELGCRAMGTTAALLAIKDNRATALNVGDSRVYLYRNKKLRQLTSDHTMVYRMYLEGEITKEEARVHERSNILYQHVGMNRRFGKPKPFVVSNIEVQEGDIFLVCSDGLSDMIPEEVLAKRIKKIRQPDVLAQTLMVDAIEAGGYDNISVIVVKAQKEPHDHKGLKRFFLGGF